MLTNRDLSFEDMTVRYGEAAAYGCLEHIERAAGIAPQSMTGLAPELRLAHAFRIQDADSLSSPHKEKTPNDTLTYRELVRLYGTRAAYELLLTVERQGNVKRNVIYLNMDVRFQRALEALNDGNFAA